MQRIADELAIRNLLARLAHVSDWGSLEEVESCYTVDATWSTPASPHVDLPANERKGIDDIMTGVRERRAAGIQGPDTRSRHMLTTTHVAFVSDDEATVDSCFLFIDESQSPPLLRSSGRYRDTVRRVGDDWKLAARQIVMEN